MKDHYTHKFSVAPMLKYTDKHCLFFYRQLTKKTVLYTEMITTQNMLKKNIFTLEETTQRAPIAIQLAGNNPINLAQCAKKAYLLGFNEINLNIGCPSKHAKCGNFGACLMHQPNLVYQLIKSIYFQVPIPISIKMRIGTNKKNTYIFLKKFIKLASKNQYCRKFIIHARIADFRIQNPKKNRIIPPLNYQYVYQIKKDFPHLIIVLNGGIKSIKDTKKHLQYVDGVMIGRSIYKNPLMLSKIDKNIFFQKKNIQIKECLKNMLTYTNKEIKNGTRITHIIKPILNIFYNHPQSKKWKKKMLFYVNEKKNIHKLFKKIYTEF